MPSKSPTPRLGVTGRAYLLLARAGQWADVKLQDGSHAFAIPSESEPGKYHISNGRACTCPAFLGPVHVSGSARPCKHMICVSLHQQTVRDSLAELAQVAPHDDRQANRAFERRYLAARHYRQLAQEVLASTLTERQRRAAKYADIFQEYMDA